MSPPRISINFYEIEILPIGPGISNGQRMFVPAERLGPVCRSAFTFEANGARLPPMGFLFSCFFFLSSYSFIISAGDFYATIAEGFCVASGGTGSPLAVNYWLNVLLPNWREMCQHAVTATM